MNAHVIQLFLNKFIKGHSLLSFFLSALKIFNEVFIKYFYQYAFKLNKKIKKINIKTYQ